MKGQTSSSQAWFPPRPWSSVSRWGRRRRSDGDPVGGVSSTCLGRLCSKMSFLKTSGKYREYCKELVSCLAQIWQYSHCLDRWCRCQFQPFKFLFNLLFVISYFGKELRNWGKREVFSILRCPILVLWIFFKRMIAFNLFWLGVRNAWNVHVDVVRKPNDWKVHEITSAN